MLHILGSPRSGTTLISQSICAHPNVIVPHDIDFVAPVAFILDRVRDKNVGRKLVSELVVNTASFDISIGEYLTKDQVRTLVFECAYKLPSIVDAILTNIGHQLGKRIVGYKSTKELDCLNVLFRANMFSENSKVIHIIRDCRDVMASLISLGWIAEEKTHFAITWANQNLLLNEVMSKKCNYYMVRYEDFVLTPKHTLEKICGFIGVDYTDEMLDPKKRHKRYSKMRDIHGRIYLEIDSSRVGIYKDMSVSLMNKYTSQAHVALENFGYSIESHY